jgi:hypothetical protein
MQRWEQGCLKGWYPAHEACDSCAFGATCVRISSVDELAVAIEEAATGVLYILPLRRRVTRPSLAVQRNAFPPQINVVGSIIFFVSVGVVALTTLWQFRQAARPIAPV